MSEPRVIEGIGELQDRLRRDRARGARVGLVPTMGALHAGHRSLIERARQNDDVVVVSVFVNPLQFGPGEDFERYPRTLDRDVEACAAAGANVVFAPSAAEMFPAPAITAVSVAGLCEPLEGAARPGHMEGVATVVAKLFGIVGECSAYFGEKDFQQLAVIRRMVADLSIDVRVVGCPTVRGPDGLALSSRNAYLSPAERAQAPALHRALKAGAALVAAGETDPAAVEVAMASVIAACPLAEIDYAAAVDPNTLAADGPLSGEVRLVLAARFGRARLIDNIGCRVP